MVSLVLKFKEMSLTHAKHNIKKHSEYLKKKKFKLVLQIKTSKKLFKNK